MTWRSGGEFERIPKAVPKDELRAERGLDQPIAGGMKKQASSRMKGAFHVGKFFGSQVNYRNVRFEASDQKTRIGGPDQAKRRVARQEIKNRKRQRLGMDQGDNVRILSVWVFEPPQTNTSGGKGSDHGETRRVPINISDIKHLWMGQTSSRKPSF